jgi:two-component system chemotaxis sensor kinase CheA
MSNQFQNVFIEEAKEIISLLENDFIAIESNVDDLELMNRIFRSLHTLKGSGAMFDFDRLSTFAHELETLFDLIRNGKKSITPEIITLSLKSIDILKEMLDQKDNTVINDALEQQLINQMHQLIPPSDEKSIQADSVSSERVKSASGKSSVYRVFFKPDRDVLLRGINPLIILKNMASLGKMYCSY